MSTPPSTRSSTRRHHSPPRYEEEQANIHLGAKELLDLRHALHASMISDIDDESESDTVSSDESDIDEKEVEKKESSGEWMTETVDVTIPPFMASIGKQHDALHATTPLNYLQLFLPFSLMQQLASNTTSYAHFCGEHYTWYTTPEELYAFIGVHIYMGIVKLPSIRMYWSQSYQQPFISSLFNRDRFEQLLRFFRVAPHTQPSLTNNPLSDVLPLIESLQFTFSRMYLPSRYLTLDEAMVAFKGRSSIKQYVPSKPHKWGYKIYCLASDDYLLHFDVYEGKEDNPSSLGATYDLVMRMTRTYQFQQHVLFTDSWFTSPILLDALKQKGIYTCGSVRKNRVGMPHIPIEELRDLNKGEWIHKQKGDTSLVVWKDKKPVWILYNHVSPNEVSSLKRWNDSGNKVLIGCPKAVHDYFYNSRSVDVCGQLHYSYPPGRKSKRPWLRLAWWLIDMCIVNAFILYRMDQQGVTQLTFREELMHSLVKMFGSNQVAMKASRGGDASVALAKDHYSLHAEQDRDCMSCSHRPIKRVRTNYICAKCQVHLCVGECFACYHG
jgi:hypothetical protein